MNDKRHYIELSQYKIIYDDKKKLEIDNTKSWVITYKEDKNCFLCEKKSSNKITEMKDVEQFIRIWNYDAYHKIDGNYSEEASIKFYIQNECFSEHTCRMTGKGATQIPVVIIQGYINSLKNIIEEKDKNDKIVDEDYNLI
ncbi:unnamed protein product [Cunninghamella blakesleeana]